VCLFFAMSDIFTDFFAHFLKFLSVCRGKDWRFQKLDLDKMGFCLKGLMILEVASASVSSGKCVKMSFYAIFCHFCALVSKKYVSLRRERRFGKFFVTFQLELVC